MVNAVLIQRMLIEPYSWVAPFSAGVERGRPGAMGTIGAAEVLKQPADGYSVLSVSLPAMVAPALLPNVSFRLDTDFAPVIKLATAYHVLVVHPSVPAKSISELVALIKARP